MAMTTIDDYLHTMERTFRPENARGAHAVLQYHFTGRESGACYASVEDGTLHLAHGVHPAPTTTVTVDFDLWQRILAYEIDGLMAYQAGQYTIAGEIETLMDSDLWFARSPA